jgi:CxxC motif-containing protein
MDGDRIADITGNTCKRGESYARTEMTDPRRTLTTTVRVHGGDRPVVPVKSHGAIPKGMMMECMRALDAVCMGAPVHIGDVIVKDIRGTGVDIIATDDVL